jgi:hypothetical protein
MNIKKLEVNIKKLEDYQLSEIQHFDEMHKALKEYNARLRTKNPLPLLGYTDHQMSEYSAYREILLGEQARE